jgi:hypothetical protein
MKFSPRALARAKIARWTREFIRHIMPEQEFAMFDFFILIAVFNFIWNTDEPFCWSLSVSEDGLRFRAKYPQYYRLKNHQEKIDALALQLARSGRADRYVKRD